MEGQGLVDSADRESTWGEAALQSEKGQSRLVKGILWIWVAPYLKTVQKYTKLIVSSWVVYVEPDLHLAVFSQHTGLDIFIKVWHVNQLGDRVKFNRQRWAWFVLWLKSVSIVSGAKASYGVQVRQQKSGEESINQLGMHFLSNQVLGFVFLPFIASNFPCVDWHSRTIASMIALKMVSKLCWMVSSQVYCSVYHHIW